MKEIDCLFIGHNAMTIRRQVQLAEMSSSSKSYYFKDSLEKRFIKYNNTYYTASQLFNLFYNKDDQLAISYDHTTFINRLNSAITQLGTHLVRDGYTIDYLNTFNERNLPFETKLKESKIHAIVIVTTFYNSAFPIIEIVKYIRKFNSQAKIIIGGPFVYNAVSSLDKTSLSTLFDRLGGDIFIYSHEGEQTLSKVIGAIKSNTSLETIDNIYFKQDVNYIYTVTKKEEISLTKHLNEWEYFKSGLTNHVNVRTSISCPFNCNYCGLPGHGGTHRLLTIKEIEKELNQLHNSGVHHHIFFIDETLNYPPDRFKSILKMMIKNNYKFKWEAEIRCQFVDEEMSELMKESGCEMLFCGIESGNQTVLDTMNKQVRVEEYYRGISLLHKYNILTTALLIIGFPGETLDTFNDTFNFIEQAKPTFYRVHRWFYDIDTPIYKLRNKYNIVGSGYNWSHNTMNIEMADKLSDKISFEIKNSIHTADYPPIFDLLCRGYKKEQALEYLKYFDYAVREKCTNPSIRETSPELIEQLKSILK